MFDIWNKAAILTRLQGLNLTHNRQELPQGKDINIFYKM
ncbi:hypothetical protein LDG_8830 [Legionella drancourtii LLAP12]|uniref:Uncharacterized protein n=1 Tax=Legionella drancourtii LLAP12 TaxID=658187 RepID=G9EU40_9GAMM|nr:hypothetical protein LDG_8830 [Legionella drancourtii LLAP12]